MKFPAFAAGVAFLLAIPAAPVAPAMAATAAATVPCSGHQSLPMPRPEGSCTTVQAQTFPSPDGMIHAVVLPSDVDLYGTPDLESRLVFRDTTGKTLTSQDYSSPRGENGYYVVSAKWSPDSQFFVFSLSSSGGHSPWSFPMWVYSRAKNAIVSFSDMIGGNPTLSGDFTFTPPHTIKATTWQMPGSDATMPVTVDLAMALAKLPPSP